MIFHILVKQPLMSFKQDSTTNYICAFTTSPLKLLGQWTSSAFSNSEHNSVYGPVLRKFCTSEEFTLSVLEQVK